MAGNSIIIYTDGYRGVARLLAAPQTTTEKGLTTWENTLNALGPCWGDDHMGEMFSQRYVPSQTNTAQTLRDVIDGIQGLIDDFNLMASNSDATEQANSQ